MNNSDNEEGNYLSMTFLFVLSFHVCILWSILIGSYTFHLSRTNNIMNYTVCLTINLICGDGYKFVPKRFYPTVFLD